MMVKTRHRKSKRASEHDKAKFMKQETLKNEPISETTRKKKSKNFSAIMIIHLKKIIKKCKKNVHSNLMTIKKQKYNQDNPCQSFSANRKPLKKEKNKLSKGQMSKIMISLKTQN